MKPLFTPLALALVAGLGLAAPLAGAQSTGGQAVEAAQIPDAKLESFVEAADAIRGVMDEHRPQLEAAETEADRQAMTETVNAEIVKAVEQTPGITLDEYVEIARAVRENPDLERRVRDLMSSS